MALEPGTWRTIPGLPLYEASDTGLIRSKSRSVRAHAGFKTYRKVIPGKILEARRRVTDGREHYLDIKIGGVNRYVHRLVAMAWHPDTWFEGAEVNHINGDTYDNRACNLEWVTRSANLLHSYRVLGRNARKGLADARRR